MPTDLQQTIILALDAIEARLSANHNDPGKVDLIASATTLVGLLRDADAIALSDAAGAVADAAANLKAIVDQAGTGPLDLVKLSAAGSTLRQAATKASVGPPPAAAPAPAVNADPAGGAAELKGIDCADDCTARAGAIAAAGKNFVLRYYRNSASKYPPLTSQEAKALSSAGLTIGVIWESLSNTVSHFSHTTGLDEGSSAYKQALLVGQPAGTAIYFAVDYDCSPEELAGSINDYFSAVAAAFAAMGHGNSAYSIGVYGSAQACAWLSGHGLVTKTWLAMSTGWAGFPGYSGWNIKQSASDGTLPLAYDDDVANGDFGGFKI